MNEITPSMLIIEDTVDDELLSVRAAKRSGVDCEVLVMRTGQEAIARLLSDDGPRPELILLDFHLPNFNGLEILRELRRQEKFRFVPIVMLSSLESDKQFGQCMDEGANSCVRKPDEPAEYVADVSLLVKYWLAIHRSPPKVGSGGLGFGSLPTVAIISGALKRLNGIRDSSVEES